MATILKDEKRFHDLGRNSQFQCTTLVGTFDTLEPAHKWAYPSKFFASFPGELRKSLMGLSDFATTVCPESTVLISDSDICLLSIVDEAVPSCSFGYDSIPGCVVSVKLHPQEVVIVY